MRIKAPKPVGYLKGIQSATKQKLTAKESDRNSYCGLKVRAHMLSKLTKSYNVRLNFKSLSFEFEFAILLEGSQEVQMFCRRVTYMDVI